MVEGLLILACLFTGCAAVALVALAVAWDMSLRDLLAWVWHEIREAFRAAGKGNPYE